MDSSKIETVAPEKLKDVLITRTAIRTFKSESIVEKVISHQFKEARDALKRHSQVEITGFGKFMLSQTKLIRKIQKHEKTINGHRRFLEITDSERKKQVMLDRIAVLEEELSYLKTKIENEN